MKETDVSCYEIDEQILDLSRRLEEAKSRRKTTQLRRDALSKKFHHVRLLRDAVGEKINDQQFEKNSLREHLETTKEESIRIAAKLQKFMQLNPINDAFFIWYIGPFGTINTFRLGMLPVKPIEWTEINAALGQAVLAISTVAAKAGYEFKKYGVYPMGSFPKFYKLEDVNKRSPLTLYTDGSWQLFPKTNFNNAMTAFLTCVYELGEYTRARDPTLALPYSISVSEGKVSDQIVLFGAEEEMWTRALKFLLTDIKWIIAWATKHCNNSNNIISTSKVSK